MQLWTINELMHLTRDELVNLDSSMRQALRQCEPGTPERTDALTTLDNIQRVMTMRGLRY